MKKALLGANIFLIGFLILLLSFNPAIGQEERHLGSEYVSSDKELLRYPDTGALFSTEQRETLSAPMNQAGTFLSFPEQTQTAPLPENQQKENPEPEYAEDEVLVKFEETADPESVLQEAGLQAKNIERIHNIKSVVNNFKKGYKLEKKDGGWYWFRGKQYKEIEDVPDKEVFDEVYQRLSPTQKNLYRSYKITLPGGISVKQAVAVLERNDNVEYAQPNYIYKTSATSLPDVPYVPDDYFIEDNENLGYWRELSWEQAYPDMWGLQKIQAIEAFNKFADPISDPGDSVIVAVIDTGVDHNHVDLADNIWENAGEIPDNDIDDDGNGYIDDIRGWSFSGGNNDPMDRFGHGTHCAGTIAAVGNNEIGVIGVAPKAKIMPVKGLNDSGSGYTAGLAECIIYAADNGAQVLSNSWGMGWRYPRDSVLEEAVDYAYDLNCVVVFAAGNNRDDAAFYCPQNSSKTITVAAMDHGDIKADFSCWGSLVDVGAPGGDTSDQSPNLAYINILSLNAREGDNYLASLYARRGFDVEVEEDYLRLRGTSMACPHVAGLAALIISYNREVHLRELNSEEVRQIIRLSADPITDPFGNETDWGSPNSIVGAGRINALGALEISDYATSIPVVKITSPTNLSNFASEDNIAVEGIVSVEGITQEQITLEYTYHPDLRNTSSPDTPLDWTEVTGLNFDPLTGEVTGTIDVSGIGQGWFVVRLKADTTFGTAYDTVVVKIDYLELFEITEPDFNQYGYRMDFLLGQKGPLTITFAVPDIDYAGLGLDVELEVRARDKSVYPYPDPIEIGSVVNPSGGTWSVAFDTLRFKDWLYDIYFIRKATIGGITHYSTDTFKGITSVSYHVNNTHIYFPHHGAIFNEEHSGPIQISGYSVMPIERIEAGVGMNPDWVSLPIIQITQYDEYLEFIAELDPQDFDLSYETLIDIRVINDVDGNEVENERVAIIVDSSVASGWPERSQNSQGTFEFVLGDVNGDEKDDIVVAGSYGEYIWTWKEYYEGNLMITEPRCYLYHNNGELNQTCLINSESIMQQDMEGVVWQYTYGLGLANLDDSPGQEIVVILAKLSADMWPRKHELLALTKEGLYPEAWNRVIDDDFDTSFIQRVGIGDADMDGKSEIFLDRLIASPSPPSFEEETRILSLVDCTGAVLLEKDAEEYFADVGNMYYGDTLSFGDIDQTGNSKIFININNTIPGEEPDSTRVKPHPLLLDADTFEIVAELPIPEGPTTYVLPIAGNIDDDDECELLFMAGKRELLVHEGGTLSTVICSIYAYNTDGTTVSGWPYLPQQEPGTPPGEQWLIEDFKLIDIDKDGKTEVLVKEYHYDYDDGWNSYDRLNLLTPEGEEIEGWPQEIPAGYYVYIDSALISDIDDDGEMEFIIPGSLISDRRRCYKDGLGSTGFGGLSRWSPHPVFFFETNGGVSKIKYLPAYGYLGLGNIDDDTSTELVAAYTYTDINISDTHDAGIYLEVVAFDLNSPYKPENIPWGQNLANAQHKNIYEESNNHSSLLAPIGDKQGQEGEWFVIPRIVATDPNPDNLTIEAANLPSGVRFFPTDVKPGYAEYKLRWPAKFVKEGVYENITFTARDGKGGITQETITIDIVGGNQPPEFSPSPIPEQYGTEGVAFNSELITLTDSDGPNMNFASQNLPAGAYISMMRISPPNLLEFRITWPAEHVVAGDYTVIFVADDGIAPQVSEPITIHIAGASGNYDPTLHSIGDRQGQEGQWFAIKSIVATDPDNDTLTIEATNLPSGVRFFPTDSRGGYVEYKLKWPDRFVREGIYENITFTVRDGNSGTDQETIKITIAE